MNMDKNKKKKQAKQAFPVVSKPKYPKPIAGERIRQVLAAASSIIAILLIAFFMSLDISGILKFIISVIVLGANGRLLIYLLNLEGDMGLILVRLGGGKEKIEDLGHRYGKYWNDLSDIGLVMGFGLSSRFAFKHISRKTFTIGVLVFLALVFLLLPNSATITFSLIQIPLESVQAASGMAWLAFVTLGVVLLFGVVGFAMLGILANALSILASIVSYLMGNATALATSAPGVYPVLPYFTIPLFEGLIALLVLMVVHEGSHGIAAVVSKIRVKSTGLITFGFIPVGAFVDIDEKQLDERKDVENARVSVAGSAANMIVALMFFIPTAFLLMSLPAFQQPLLKVTNVIKNIDAIGAPIEIGTLIYAVNGVPVNSSRQYVDMLENMTANSTIILATDKGESMTKLIADGMPGFVVAQPLKPDFEFIRPIFTTLGLITILNLLIGIINLLPLPSFDGHRLFKIIFKDQRIVNAFMIIILAAFLMNIVPWIWQ